ncbi:DNA-binding transcriptional regulator, LysR family [Anaerocolumna jejuensis DSM 15929]|uniref:DNA-binding transcriptional regulator, LysR family n=1 Tax=Anaerocolumna jejuensis DSM 15929 TaxID=1121322 RepID=A0A1M6Y5C4_9FIRM|nr:LysR family transcriptional regulator [Anaerocolumna jejuensis]SHL13392.1 DNA-binding transcriptional regulator, LysR family [Anaerocolumna jejuensis DSM 15929]
MDISLEYYKIFYYVAKMGSFTAAAEKLNISQPAVSQAVKLLERELGGNFFLRTQKGVRMTPEGDMLFSYISSGYETILKGEENLRKLLDLENGEIRIGASDMTLQFYLLPYLEEFHKRYPGIKVSVTNGPTPETLSYLYEGKIDFGIVSEPFMAKPEVTSLRVKEIQDIFVAGNSFAHLSDKELEYKELEELPIICLEGLTSTRTYVDEILKNNGVVLKTEFELATSDMIVQFSLRNLGVGSVVRDFAREYIDRGELFELKLKRPLPPRHFCIVTSSKNPEAMAAKSLLSMMISEKEI